MFFTTRKIRAVIFDLDSFEASHDTLHALVATVHALDLDYAFASTGDAEKNIVYDEWTVYSQTLAESFLFRNVIRRAVLWLDKPPSECVFIAGNGQNLRSAHELLLGTIVLLDRSSVSPEDKVEIYQQFPDFIVYDVEGVAKCLDGRRRGYSAEVKACPSGVDIFERSPIEKYITSRVPNKRHPDCPVAVAGRYFDTTDPRFYLHPLSVRIINSKKAPERQAECFGMILLDSVALIAKNGFDFITWIPPKPNKADRMSLYLNYKKSEYVKRGIEPAQLRPDLLTLVRTYDSLKNYNYSDRQTLINGAFKASPDASGKRIVLLDDVQTTGATINEAIKVLKLAGAKVIYPIALAYHPYAVQTLALPNQAAIPSDCCDAELVPRCNTRTGQPFYGCSGWRPGENRKHSDKSFAEVISLKLKMFEGFILMPDEEVDAWDVDF